MNYIKNQLLTIEQNKLLIILQDYVKNNYHILCHIQLNTILSLSSDKDTSNHNSNMKDNDNITLPFVIYDTTSREIKAVLSLSTELKEAELLSEQGIVYIHLNQIDDALTNKDLIDFYSDSF